MKNILKYLIIFVIAAGFAAGAVSASDFSEHDFDGNFKALAPANVTFNEENGTAYHVYVANDNEELAYLYFSFEGITNDNLNYIYGLLSDMGFNKINSTGNLTLFQIDDSGYGQYGAAVHNNGHLVCVVGNNLTEVEQIGESISFS